MAKNPSIWVSHHCAKFGDDTHCGSEDKIISGCQVISQDHITQEPSDFAGKSSLI